MNNTSKLNRRVRKHIESLGYTRTLNTPIIHYRLTNLTNLAYMPEYYGGEMVIFHCQSQKSDQVYEFLLPVEKFFNTNIDTIKMVISQIEEDSYKIDLHPDSVSYRIERFPQMVDYVI